MTFSSGLLISFSFHSEAEFLDLGDVVIKVDVHRGIGDVVAGADLVTLHDSEVAHHSGVLRQWWHDLGQFHSTFGNVVAQHVRQLPAIAAPEGAGARDLDPAHEVHPVWPVLDRGADRDTLEQHLLGDLGNDQC